MDNDVMSSSELLRNKYSDQISTYGYEYSMEGVCENYYPNFTLNKVENHGNAINGETIGILDGQKRCIKRKKTTLEVKQLAKMSEILCRSSFRFSPISSKMDKELSRSGWSREDIALFCLRSMNNNMKRAIKSYKSFTMMMYKYNNRNGNEIDIRNPTILSQLRTGKVVILDKLDLYGRLLIIINLHHHNPKLQTVDDLILLFVFVIELIMKENPYNGAAEKNGISILINASKVRVVDFRIEFCLRIAQLLTHNFPIKLGQILIFKPKRLIKFSIKLVLLSHKSLKKRFQIINKVFEPLNSITGFDALSHFIDRKNIPIEFGGKHDFVSDRFWEIKYQGHILTELLQKNEDNIDKNAEKSRRNSRYRRYVRRIKRNQSENNDDYCMDEERSAFRRFYLENENPENNQTEVPKIKITLN
ncbi:Sec14d domain containing protein [Cryptosporidium ryanae]|uniref:Sec14d domain containing protein n=1 Tax=Cryptosporidium ryanae TaxID=515981 RepID=UPI00351A9F40|nr:Sec14d domain containing protein [Cryptosporidium ryanae]